MKFPKNNIIYWITTITYRLKFKYRYAKGQPTLLETQKSSKMSKKEHLDE